MNALACQRCGGAVIRAEDGALSRECGHEDAAAVAELSAVVVGIASVCAPEDESSHERGAA